jgi:hypothetical protein
MWDWHTKQLDFVQAFPQTKTDCTTCMEIPKGVDLAGKNHKDYVLEIINSLCGQKQAGHAWFKHLVKGLEDIGFTKSKYMSVSFILVKVSQIYVGDSFLL